MPDTVRIGGEMKDELVRYLGSGIPLMICITKEVSRAIKNIKEIVRDYNASLKDTTAPEYIQTNGYALGEWDVNTGWKVNDKVIPGYESNGRALIDLTFKYIKVADKNGPPPGVYIVQNLHTVCDNADTKPILIQDIIDLANIRRPHRAVILVESDIEGIPEEIMSLMTVLDFSLPTRADIKAKLAMIEPLIARKFDDRGRDTIADAASGMTLYEIDNVLRSAAVASEGRDINVRLVMDEKAKTVKRSGFLEYVRSEDKVEDVGGLANMKGWLEDMAFIYANRDNAMKYGCKLPKGMVVVGITGCGKSLIGKATSNLFGVPLFRGNLGRMMGGIVGETERNVRTFFTIVEALSPAVFLLDEVEKMFAGHDRSLDAGVMNRMLEAFLTFLQEKNCGSFFICTANDISTLPPEFMRKGRFNQLWFVDLPNEEELKSIFEIHIRKSGRDVRKYDIGKLVSKTEGFTGAEVEAVIQEAMTVAFKSSREYTTKDVLNEIAKTCMISKTKEAEINALRSWAKGRARIANVKTATEHPAWWDKVEAVKEKEAPITVKK
jgi:ATP-dependent 26S proteasome regulatory subunit